MPASHRRHVLPDAPARPRVVPRVRSRNSRGSLREVPGGRTSRRHSRRQQRGAMSDRVAKATKEQQAAKDRERKAARTPQPTGTGAPLAWEVSRDWQRERFNPVCRRGTTITCADGTEVSMGDGVKYQDMTIIGRLTTARDAPKDGEGNVRRQQ